MQKLFRAAQELSGNNTNGEPMNTIASKLQRLQATCPRNDEESGHRQLSPTETPLHDQPTDRHRVSTSQYVATIDGEAVLVAEASCVCGWTDRTVFRGDDGG